MLKWCASILLVASWTGMFAQTTFTETANNAGIYFVCPVEEMGGGCAFFDFDNDQFQDLIITGGTNPVGLFRNNGDGTFSDVTPTSGFGVMGNEPTMGVVTGDIDNDGDRDVFISTMLGYASYMFENNGDGTFTNITTSSGLDLDTAWSYSATFGDYDKDGFLDLYVGNYLDSIGFITDSTGATIGYDHRCSENRLWRNNGNNTFSDVSAITSTSNAGCALANLFTDYDNDNDLDLMTANDFGEWVLPNSLLRNEYPSNHFSEVAVASNTAFQMYGMGIASGDYDHDMDLDYYITNIGRNILHQNNNDGTFNYADSAAGVSNTWVIQDSTRTTGWGTVFFDIDNDSWQDLYCANGYIEVVELFETAYRDPDVLYKNNGDGSFTDISLTSNIADTSVNRGFAFADYDRDGDIDFIAVSVSNAQQAQTYPIKLLRNDLNNAYNYLQITLEGTTSNRDAFGAHIEVHSGNKHWLEELNCGGTHGSQNTSVIHLGLGIETLVDSISIIWPSGIVDSYYSIAANQSVHYIESHPNGILDVKEDATFSVYPNPFAHAFTIYIETESAYDFTLFDIYGHRVLKGSGSGKKEVDLKSLNLPRGHYLIQIHHEQMTATVVLQKD